MAMTGLQIGLIVAGALVLLLGLAAAGLFLVLVFSGGGDGTFAFLYAF